MQQRVQPPHADPLFKEFMKDNGDRISGKLNRGEVTHPPSLAVLNLAKTREVQSGSEGIDHELQSPLPSIIALTFNIGDNSAGKMRHLATIVRDFISSKQPDIIVIALQECGDQLKAGNRNVQRLFHGYNIVENTPVNRKLGANSDFRLSILLFKKNDSSFNIVLNSDEVHRKKQVKQPFKGYLVVDVTIDAMRFKFV